MLAQRLFDLLADARNVSQQLREAMALDHERVKRRLGNHGGVPRLTCHESDFTEPLSRTNRGDDFSAGTDARCAVDNDDELATFSILCHDLLASTEVDLIGNRRNFGELVRVAIGE